MRLRAEQFLGRIATSLMLLGVAAFVQQGAMIVASQAAALSGSMLHPAVETISGSVHLHDNLAGNVHSHGGDNAAGHVHDHADHDDHDADEAGKTLLWSLAGTSVVIPIIEACVVSFCSLGLRSGPCRRVVLTASSPTGSAARRVPPASPDRAWPPAAQRSHVCLGVTRCFFIASAR